MATQKKRVMDAETRKKLYGFLPFSKEATIEYTPEVFNKEELGEYTPVFIIRPFKKEEINKARSVISQIASVKEEDKEKAEELENKASNYARLVIVDWKNVFDLGSGEEIKFECDDKGSLKEELYNDIPNTVKGLILAEAMKISGLIDITRLGLR